MCPYSCIVLAVSIICLICDVHESGLSEYTSFSVSVNWTDADRPWYQTNMPLGASAKPSKIKKKRGGIARLYKNVYSKS